MNNEVREWKRFLLPYEQAVEELKIKFKSIRDAYREVGEYSPIEFLTGRVKKVSSILAKARLRDIKYENIETEMEDIAGIRIMCQLIDDIYTVVDLIKERDGKDFTIEYMKDYINDVKDSGYRSFHIIIKYPVNTAWGYKEVLAEIQIRTLAMNFWATIEHSLNYKFKKNIPDHIKSRLQSAAKSVWDLDMEMAKIKEDIISAQVEFEVNSNITREITNSLILLRNKGHEDLAKKYQIKFDSILDLSSNEKLSELLDMIRKEMDGLGENFFYK